MLYNKSFQPTPNSGAAEFQRWVLYVSCGIWPAILLVRDQLHRPRPITTILSRRRVKNDLSGIKNRTAPREIALSSTFSGQLHLGNRS